MAESNLSPSLNTFKREVGTFMGWGRDYTAWTANQNTDFTYIMDRALRTFYFPHIAPDIPRYEWEFLKTVATITLADADWDYDLPDDFSGAIHDNSMTYSAGSEDIPLMKVEEEDIRKFRAQENAKGPPRYFAIRPKTFDATVGQRWEVIFYPQPGPNEAADTITYRYTAIPDRLSGANIYPRGGGQFGETMIYSFLAAAEAMLDDDPNGPYSQKFKESMALAIRIDTSQKMTDPNPE